MTCSRLDALADHGGLDPDHVDLPLVVPPGSAATVSLRVLTLTRRCWKCTQDTVCLVGLYPARPGRGYVGLFTTDNSRTMALARRLCEQNGKAELAATITSRYSRTMRERQLSNGCRHCDALQGNFPVHDEALGHVADAGVDGLDTTLVADCPVLEWQAVVHDRSGGVMAV